MTRGSAEARRSSRRAGMTLLEVVAVLVLLGVGTALVVPALRAPTQGAPEDGLHAVLASARREALRRAEPLTLTVGPAGGWSLTGRAEAVATGTLDGTPVPGLVVHVSPLGACTLAGEGAASLRIDPVRCRIAP